MNFPAASHGVSIDDKIFSNAASYGELNPADFADSLPLILCNLCNLRNLRIKFKILLLVENKDNGCGSAYRILPFYGAGALPEKG